MDEIKIGIIGGSGLYDLDNIKILEELEVKTPFGSPSDKYIIGSLNDIKIAFLPRHGKGHKLLPSELNSRANIYGFKKLGVKYLIAVSAVGSLQKEIEPTHLVFPNQIIDRTKGRQSTFFGNGIVSHASFEEPFCCKMIDLFEICAKELNINYHRNKTYVCMEGPMFSTRAESKFHRMIGGDLIGMTAIPESKLAREAEMCYAMIALSTDYDCWHVSEEPVSLELILENLNKNVENAKRMIGKIIEKIEFNECECHNALENVIYTKKELWPEDTKKKLELLIKRFI